MRTITDDNNSPADHWGKSSPAIAALTDQQLVGHCSTSKDHTYWNEFFRRFIPIIKSTIRSVIGNREQDEDIVWDIHAKLVKKFYTDDQLTNCTNLDGFRTWLKAVTTNQAIEWLKAEGRKKNLSRKQAERKTVSLFDLIGSSDDDDLQLIDRIADPGATRPDANILPVLETSISDALINLVQEQQCLIKPSEIRNYWILRLAIIAAHPIEQEELDKLVRFSTLPVDEIQETLDSISASLRNREAKREAKLSRAQQYLSEIHDLQWRLRQSLADDTDTGVKTRLYLENQIEKISQIRNKRLAEGLKIPRPSNMDIARLVGISVQQSGQVSKILERLRDMLQKKLANSLKETGQ